MRGGVVHRRAKVRPKVWRPVCPASTEAGISSMFLARLLGMRMSLNKNLQFGCDRSN